MQSEEPLAGYAGNPQTEDGFTRIANELLEAICSFDFTKRQYKILLCLARKTYGYGKKSDDITVSQLAKQADMPLSHASNTIKELIGMNVISFDGNGRYGKILSINKIYDSWVTKTVTYQNSNVTKTVTMSYQNSNNELPKQSFDVTKTVNTKENSKRKLQKKTPKESSAFALACPDDVDRQVWIDWLSLRKSKKAPVTETVVNMAILESSKAGMSFNAFLQEWVIRGSQGLKADWLIPNNRGSPDRPKNNSEKFNDAFRNVFGENHEPAERDITAIATRVD